MLFCFVFLGTGFSIRFTTYDTRQKGRGYRKPCVEFVFTTGNKDKKSWSHNELACSVDEISKNKFPQLIHISCVYDASSKLQSLQLNKQAIVCRNIDGIYKPETRHNIHIGINPCWKARKFYGIIKNIKFDWPLDDT